MALTIESPEAERLARELAANEGTSVEALVLEAIQEKAERAKRRQEMRDGIREIQERVAKLPVLDDRPADELLGYDEWGLPH
jgi:antitoxin VapB